MCLYTSLALCPPDTPGVNPHVGQSAESTSPRVYVGLIVFCGSMIGVIHSKMFVKPLLCARNYMLLIGDTKWTEIHTESQLPTELMTLRETTTTTT